jgi:hypothetical protein
MLKVFGEKRKQKISRQLFLWGTTEKNIKQDSLETV